MLFKKVFFKVFSKLKGKQPRQSLFLNKAASLSLQRFYKRDSDTNVFREFCEILNNTVIKKHLRISASVF